VKINSWDTGIEAMNWHFHGKGIQKFMLPGGNKKMPDALYDTNNCLVTKGEVEGN